MYKVENAELVPADTGIHVSQPKRKPDTVYNWIQRYVLLYWHFHSLFSGELNSSSPCFLQVSFLPIGLSNPRFIYFGLYYRLLYADILSLAPPFGTCDVFFQKLPQERVPVLGFRPELELPVSLPTSSLRASGTLRRDNMARKSI